MLLSLNVSVISAVLFPQETTKTLCFQASDYFVILYLVGDGLSF
jgi:hypothetical protein